MCYIVAQRAASLGGAAGVHIQARIGMRGRGRMMARPIFRRSRGTTVARRLQMTAQPRAETPALSVRGPVLRAGDDGFDAARRIWNAMIDRHPSLVVRCAGAADVVAAVNFARDQNLRLA